MHRIACRRSVVTAAALVVFASACSRSAPAAASSTARGTALQTFDLTVYRPTGGTVTSADGQITCGTTGSNCTATYAWSDTVALTATADAGQMFGTWAGDCDGRTLDANGQYICVLATVPYGADKYVVAVFGDAGQAMHGNWVPNPPAKPTVHGYEFRNFIQFRNGGSGDYFDCTYCHGDDYAGRGIAPSCNQCHANYGHASWQSECNFCHGAPPPPLAQNPPHTATHPVTGSSDPVSCHACHVDTVDANGQIIPASAGGKHMDGLIEAQGHAQVFDPAQHGPMFRDAVAAAATVPGAAPSCASCHSSDAGATYAVAIVPTDPTLNPNGYASCDACHAGNGWSSSYWQANCTFCHGTKIQSGLPTSVDMAPPDAVSQRLTGVEQPAQTGWHGLHLANGQFAPSPNYDCSGCHTVPATVAEAGHVTTDRRAVVTLNASAFPGLSQTDIGRLPNPLGTYDPSTGSCTVYCHGSTMAADLYAPKVAVVWTNDPGLMTPIFNCTDCHGSPPMSGSIVVGHSGYPPTVPYTPTSTIFCGTSGCVNHRYHALAQTQFGYDSCANCHYGSAQGTYYAGIHANGRKDVVPSGTNVGSLSKPVTFTWDPVAKTCSNTSCHTRSGITVTQSW